MNLFTSLGLREAYRKVEQLGNRLTEITKLIDWEAFKQGHESLGILFINANGLSPHDIDLAIKMLRNSSSSPRECPVVARFMVKSQQSRE